MIGNQNVYNSVINCPMWPALRSLSEPLMYNFFRVNGRLMWPNLKKRETPQENVPWDIYGWLYTKYVFCVYPSKTTLISFWFHSLINVLFITKTCLFKYTENFTTKKWKFSDKKFWYFSYFYSKHWLWYSLEPPWGGSNEYPQSMILSRNKKKTVNPSFTIWKWGLRGSKFGDGSSLHV